MPSTKRTSLCFLVLAGLALTPGPAGAAEPRHPGAEAGSDVTQGWPEASRAAAEAMRAKYGAPQEATATTLIWRDNAPWARTIVHKTGAEHDFPAQHRDVLEQTIVYKVPLNFYNAIATYNGSVIPDRTRGTITSFGDNEVTNILSINLAEGIVRGQMSAEQAREAHVAAARDLAAGKTPEAARVLTLQPQQGDLTDPDTAMILPEKAKP
jgi:hypothetical protein